MITLHNATEGTKSLLKWAAITGVSLFFIVFLYRIAVNIKEYFYPTPPPPPTVSFGKLPAINFPIQLNTKAFNYSIDTLSGNLPNLGDRAKVYKILSIEPNLLALKKTQERVTQIGFPEKSRRISDTLYEWKESSTPFKRIVFDIQSSNFTLSSEFINDSTVLSSKNLPTEEEAKTFSKAFLTKLSLFPNDIDESKTKTSLLSISNSSVTPATSLSKTNIIRVDFFQKDIEKTPILYPKSPYSTISIFVASAAFQNQVVEGHFFHQEVDTKNSATYPIKTAKEALEELKKGKAYIASLPSSNTDQVSIKNVFIGLYMEDKEQEYLMPIIVFEGNDGFYAYTSAVKDNWIKSQ